MATQACNAVKRAADIPSVLERAAAIPGILGVLLISDSQIGLKGSARPNW